MPIDWNENYEAGRDYRVMNEFLLGEILQATDSLAEGRVLDIGCGTGDLSVKLAKRGYHVTGLDLSSAAIAKAEARSKEASVSDHVIFEVADVSTPEGKSYAGRAPYDLIIVKLVYAFIEDKTAFLSWVKTMLAPGGSLVIITPVLHADIDYTPRLRNISVSLGELRSQLKLVGTSTEIYQEYFEEWGDERTFIVKPV